MNVEAVITAILAAALLSAVPLALASVGEAIGERAGLLNLGTEGVMLIGGFTGFWVALKTDSLLLGLLAGAGVGLIAGVLFGTIAIVIGADQVLLGLGLTLAGGGLTAYLFREFFASSQPLLRVSMSHPFDGLESSIPILGPALFGQKWFFYVAWLIVVAADVLMRRSQLGLRIRAVGESPFAVDSAGISVTAVRMSATSIAGLLCGLAGASLTVVELGFFQPNVTAGIGFVAIATAMLGRLSPWRIAIMAIIFGALRGLGQGLQIADVSVQPDFVQILPYVGVVVALIVIGRGVRLPSTLGQPYSRK